MLKFNSKKAFETYIQKLVIKYSWSLHSCKYTQNGIKANFYWEFNESSRYAHLFSVFSDFTKDLVEIENIVYSCEVRFSSCVNRDCMYLTPI